MCDVKKFKNYQVDTYYDDAGNKSFIEISCLTFNEFLNQVLHVLDNYDDADIIEYDYNGDFYDYDDYDDPDDYYYDDPFHNCGIDFKTTKVHDIWVKKSCEANDFGDIGKKFLSAFKKAKTHDDKVNVVIDYIYKI